MKQNETMSKEVFNKLVVTFQARMQNFGIKKGSKKYTDAQQEFMLGACAGIDAALGNIEKSCLPPSIWIDVMRGNVMEVEK